MLIIYLLHSYLCCLNKNVSVKLATLSYFDLDVLLFQHTHNVTLCDNELLCLHVSVINKDDPALLYREDIASMSIC